MNKFQIMLNAGYSLWSYQLGDRSTYYVYLSHPKYGADFAYGYGKELEEAVDMAFGLCIFKETHEE